MVIPGLWGRTTINGTRGFGLHKRPTNLTALRQIGFTANRRLLSVQYSATIQSAAPKYSPISLRRS